MKNDDLRRDKRFQKRLAQKLQVDKPPESYFQAVQNAFDNLPDELPVKRRPFRQTAFRACAALAACLVLVAAGSYGAYLVNPVLMESIPGVGQIFQELNKTEEKTPSPSPQPTWDDSHLEEALPDVPEFEPISFEGEGGTLTIENAWSDGLYLHLDTSLDLWDPALVGCEMVSFCSEPYEGTTDTSYLTVNDQQLESLFLDAQTFFTWDGSSSNTGTDITHCQGSWLYKLPEQQPHYTELAVNWFIPALYAMDDYGNILSMDFNCSAAFTVITDARHTLAKDTSTVDNGITLEQVEASPSCVFAQLSIPYFGTMDSLLLAPFMNVPEGYEVPIGIYPQLTTQDGEVISSMDFPRSDTAYISQEGLYTSPSPDQNYQLLFYFQPPSQSTTKLILTLYEYNPALYSGLAEENPTSNRVTAEFTIDLEQGSVYPSQNYMSTGRQKLDYRLSASLDRTPTPENGYICSPPNPGDGYVEINFTTQDLDYRPVELYWYNETSSESVLMGIYPSVTPNNYNATSEDRSIYQDTSYSYTESYLDPTDTQGTEYKVLRFRITGMDSPTGVAGSTSTHFYLVDSETGEILVSDVSQTFCKQFDEVMGTHTQTSHFTGSTLEEELATQLADSGVSSEGKETT